LEFIESCKYLKRQPNTLFKTIEQKSYRELEKLFYLFLEFEN